jgi:hypothetical protein
MRAKHLRTGINFVLEVVVEQRVQIHYMPTDKMIADGLTKMICSFSFHKFAKQMLGEGKVNWWALDIWIKVILTYPTWHYRVRGRGHSREIVGVSEGV